MAPKARIPGSPCWFHCAHSRVYALSSRHVPAQEFWRLPSAYQRKSGLNRDSRSRICQFSGKPVMSPDMNAKHQPGEAPSRPALPVPARPPLGVPESPLFLPLYFSSSISSPMLLCFPLFSSLFLPKFNFIFQGSGQVFPTYPKRLNSV